MNTTKDQTPIIFLAMFWGGGGPYTISQIIHVYDWINRDIPSREDLETALNTMLFLNFITMQTTIKYIKNRRMSVIFTFI